MNTSSIEHQPVFSHAEPVLAVNDVRETIKYWQDVLGFPNQWIWGDDANHGGISWHGAHLQFSKNPERAAKSVGNWIWLRLQYIDQLYKLHQERKAEITDPLSRRPWGLDEYAVRDINGYNIAFAGNSNKRETSGDFPDHIKIVERKPTSQEFMDLKKAVGWWDPFLEESVNRQLAAPIHAVVAIDTKTNETIGCALILGDHASFYYIKDVMVKPEWQKKRIGTALMNALKDWLEANGIKKSLVGLYTSEGLEDFYKQFGFQKSFGMVRSI